MAKSIAKMGFHRPHARVAYSGELVNLATGEVKKPVARTKQSFVAECDINNILKQYKVTGQIAHISNHASQGRYIDLPDSLDFQASLAIVKEAQDAFASLPSAVRNRFGNNPEAFLAFMADPANKEEARKLGLLETVPVAPPGPKPAPTAAPAPNPSPAPPPVPEGS